MTQKKQKQGELPCSVKIGNAHQHILQAALPTPRVRPPSLSMDIGGKNVVQQCEVHGNNKKKHMKFSGHFLNRLEKEVPFGFMN